MFTCCPHCKTCFRITKAQLAVAQGKVRCGTCTQIFNAREHLHETLPERKPASRPPPARTTDRRPPATAPVPPPPPAPSPEAAPPSAATPPDSGATDNAPDIDLFGFGSDGDTPQTGIEAETHDDVFLDDGDDEEEDTAVIEVGEDWDAFDFDTEEEPDTPTAEAVPEEFHAPVHEPVATPTAADDEEIDLFDEEEETEDTAVIDLTNARDPFAPHAGVPLGADPAAHEEDPELFDDEEDEDDDDVTAVIEVDDGSDLLAGIAALDAAEPAPEAPSPADAETKPPSPEPAVADLFEPDEHFLNMAREEPAPEPEPTDTDDGKPVRLPDLENFSFELEPLDGEEKGEPPPVTVADPHRYTYVDPEELREPEKDIDEIIAEMNAQLGEGSTTSEKDAPPAAPTPRPGSDDFESSFLANLDEVLTQPPPEPAAPKADAKRETPARKEAVKPAEVLDIINPADNLNQGMVPDEAIPLPLREELVGEGPGTGPLKFGLQLLLAIALLAALGLQLAVFRSTELANALPGLRPLLEMVCRQVPCRYNGPVDVDRIQLASRDIRDHPAEPGALQIKATLVNKAPFAQPFPDMEITLSDLAGSVVARRRFTPPEYLGSYWHPFLLMRPDQPVQITLDVLNPGQDAVNFEFRFLPSSAS